MLQFIFRSLLIAVTVAMSYVTWSFAGGHCCRHCGCEQGTTKVCQLVCETKKVPETKYSMKCEDFCVSGPGKKCACETGSCEKCQTPAVPQWANMFTRKKLIKTITEKEEVVYKWVVVDLCAPCAAKSEQKTEANKVEAEKSSIPLPPPPVPTPEKKVT